MTKPVFGLCDQVRHKPAWSVIETSYSLDILDVARIHIILSRQRTTKALIRLCGCAGWSAPLLFTYDRNRFSHDVAQIIAVINQNLNCNTKMQKEWHTLNSAGTPLYNTVHCNMVLDITGISVGLPNGTTLKNIFVYPYPTLSKREGLVNSFSMNSKI